MATYFTVKRTTATDPHFQLLVAHLDHELWVELEEDQATYDQFNKVEHINTAVLVYNSGQPVASGCFKQFDDSTVEIKRMYVEKEFRGKGLSKLVLKELEKWAVEIGYRYAVLETSVHFFTAIGLYQSSGYVVIPNYGPYAGLEESICMRKVLTTEESGC